MATTPKISVILPVYNPGPGINECIESLRQQRLDGLEFIFVDDCSTDESMAAVEVWAAEDDRVHILRNEENLGAGPSRNRGIEAAQGDYLSFIDPDDYISPDFYELLYDAATADSGHDIAKGLCNRVGFSGNNSLHPSDLNTKIKSCLADGQALYTVFSHEHWSAIYRRNLFENKSVRHGSTRCGEDATFLLRCCYQTNDIVMDDLARYYYVKRSDSATYACPSRKVFYQLDGLEDQLSFLAQQGVSVPQDDYSRRKCDSCLTASYRIYKDHPLDFEPSRYIQRFCGIVQSFDGYEVLLEKSAATRAAIEYGRLLPALEFVTSGYIREAFKDWNGFLVEFKKTNSSLYNQFFAEAQTQIKTVWAFRPARTALKTTLFLIIYCKGVPFTKRIAMCQTGLSSAMQTLPKYMHHLHSMSSKR